MKPIENTNLEDLVSEAAVQLINEQRHAAVSQIKETLKRVAQLSNDVKTMQEAISKKQKELDGANGMLEKLRSGEWSVLSEPKQPVTVSKKEQTESV